MTPATKLVRRLLLLPVREAEERDATVMVEVTRFKEEARRTRTLSRWIAKNSESIRNLSDELLGKLE